MKHPTYISLLTVIIVISLLFNACSPFEIPLAHTHQGILIPPSQGIPTHRAGMTDVGIIDPTIVIDLKYKTTNNFTGKALYPKNFRPLLRPKTAARLWYANKLLKEQGFKILLWDAYRPQVTQIALWEASGKDPQYVADPYKNPSLHTHGVAVDVSLVYLDGSPAPMPTKFDDFSKRASPHYFHSSPIVRRNLRTLKNAMLKAGFQYIHSEWWHFIDHEYPQYQLIENID